MFLPKFVLIMLVAFGIAASFSLAQQPTAADGDGDEDIKDANDSDSDDDDGVQMQPTAADGDEDIKDANDSDSDDDDGVQMQPRDSELKLKLFPSMAEDKSQMYRVIAFCLDENKNGTSRGADSGYATDNANDSTIALRFTAVDCASYSVHISLLRIGKEMPQNAWLDSYYIENVANREINHRVIFGNHFTLKIGPTLLETRDLFYNVRVFCDETQKSQMVVEIDDSDKGKEKTTNKWIVSDQYYEYKFNTYTKGVTKVVFNSEKRQCDKYRINVWATHWEFIDAQITERPIGYYVCEAKGRNGQNWQLSLLNHFKLQIEPPLVGGEVSAEDPESNVLVYYVEVRCHGLKMQAFKTLTKSKTDVMLHNPNCKTYDIWVRKVPLAWIRRLHFHGYKEMLHEQVPYRVSDVSIANGHTHVLNFHKRIPKKRKMIDLNENDNDNGGDGVGGSKNVAAQYTANSKQMTTFINLTESDDEDGDEDEEEEDSVVNKGAKKSELQNDCYFFYN